MSSGLGALNLFSEAEHDPFFWPGGQPAALFIHGFLGTPAEFRPLANQFHHQGWTVQAPLLPGFGAQIGTLFERRWQEWTAMIHAILQDLQTRYQPVILVGYSMGAAVALNVAAHTQPDGLALLAPFIRLGNDLQRAIWAIVKRLIPQFQPLKKADFSDPQLREFLDKILTDQELNDQQTLTALRQVRVPTRFLDEVIGVGLAAEQAAPQIQTPTLVVQGIHDQTVKLAYTRQLLQQLNGLITYQELLTDHGLVEAANPGFQRMAQSTLAFGARLAGQEFPTLALP